jgi:hypothetical protein
MVRAARQRRGSGAVNARTNFSSSDQRLERAIRELSTGLQTDSVDNDASRKPASCLVLRPMAQLSRAADLLCRIIDLRRFSASYQPPCEQKMWISRESNR